MRFILDFLIMKNIIKIWRAHAYLNICADTEDLLHRQVCRLNIIITVAEWVPVSPEFRDTFPVIVTLDKNCRELNPAAVKAEVIALISKNPSDIDAVINTD